MIPTSKAGDDEVSVEICADLDHAIGLADAWCRDMNAHNAFVVDREAKKRVYEAEGTGQFRIPRGTDPNAGLKEDE